MKAFDLIPGDYRRAIEVRRLITGYVVSLALAVSAIVASAFYLKHLTDQANTTAQQLRTDNAISEQQEVRLTQLLEEQREYQYQLAVLNGLQAGVPVEDLFAIVDRSIVPNGVWFTEWRFQRGGVDVDAEVQEVETGYFIIVSRDEPQITSNASEFDTHMAIRGQATDHKALSSFVRALFSQALVKDVRILRTSRADSPNGNSINFDITVILDNQEYRA